MLYRISYIFNEKEHEVSLNQTLFEPIKIEYYMRVSIDTISICIVHSIPPKAQLHNVGGNFLFNTAGDIDVRLSICPIRV